ncbi:unnamed protein product, partial [Polarella glacialis]
MGEDFGTAGSAAQVRLQGLFGSRVRTGDGPDEYFTLDFPLELNNTDYLRRVLAQLTFALRPIYEQAITRGGRQKIKNGKGEALKSAGVDSYYVLKHIRENLGYYSAELGQGQEFLITAVNWLNGARNELAHESLHGVDSKYLSDAFGYAKQLASATRMRFVQDNLIRLQKQVEVHQKSKQARRLPSSAAQGSREAASDSLQQQGRRLRSSAATPSSAESALPAGRDSPELGALRLKLDEYKKKGDLDNCKLLKVRVDARVQYEADVAKVTGSIEDTSAGYQKAWNRDDFVRAETLKAKLPAFEKQLRQLRDDPDGYVKRILISAKYPLVGPEGLKAMGVSVSLQELWDAGYAAEQLQKAGYAWSQLQEAGYTLEQLQEAGYPLSQLRAAGYTFGQLLLAGYTAEQFKAAGYTLCQFKAADYPLGQLLWAGFT